MSVGASPTSVQLNADMVSLIVRWRDVARASSNLEQQVVQVGHQGLIDAGFTDADATTFQTVLNYLSTLAGVFQGTATQTPAFDFEDATSKYVLGT